MKYSDSLIKHVCTCVAVVVMTVIAGISFCIKVVIDKLM